MSGLLARCLVLIPVLEGAFGVDACPSMFLQLGLEVQHPVADSEAQKLGSLLARKDVQDHCTWGRDGERYRVMCNLCIGPESTGTSPDGNNDLTLKPKQVHGSTTCSWVPCTNKQPRISKERIIYVINELQANQGELWGSQTHSHSHGGLA